MAKTDDNVKEFLEKCMQGGEHILGWCVVWSGHAFMLDAVHTEVASVTALLMKEKLDLILDNLTFNGKCMDWSQLSRIKVHIEEAKDLIMYARHSTAISDLLRKQGKDSSSKQKLQPPIGSFGCEEAANFSELADMSKLFNERVAYGETGALYATGLLDPRYHGRHTELTHSQIMMADMCIAELASADGQGTDRAAGDARFNLHQRWLMPNALQLVGLTNSVLDTVLTANPCMWWQTYDHGFGVLRDVAMRLLSIPATSASTERVFSTFKHIWSDHRQSRLMGRMWMSSYIHFNRRALKGTRGQTRSSEEERAEFEEWLQHQPNGISE
ncbi:hypothetical protein QJQ45_023942 [Haematococcus lacustris]|nr:hypothetical protein QJQ45_023942 [Haematococcus lacustris]